MEWLGFLGDLGKRLWDAYLLTVPGTVFLMLFWVWQLEKRIKSLEDQAQQQRNMTDKE
jgi:hypothetical protein